MTIYKYKQKSVISINVYANEYINSFKMEEYHAKKYNFR